MQSHASLEKLANDLNLPFETLCKEIWRVENNLIYVGILDFETRKSYSEGWPLPLQVDVSIICQGTIEPLYNKLFDYFNARAFVPTSWESPEKILLRDAIKEWYQLVFKNRIIDTDKSFINIAFDINHVVYAFSPPIFWGTCNIDLPEYINTTPYIWNMIDPIKATNCKESLEKLFSSWLSVLKYVRLEKHIMDPMPQFNASFYYLYNQSRQYALSVYHSTQTVEQALKSAIIQSDNPYNDRNCLEECLEKVRKNIGHDISKACQEFTNCYKKSINQSIADPVETAAKTAVDARYGQIDYSMTEAIKIHHSAFLMWGEIAEIVSAHKTKNMY